MSSALSRLVSRLNHRPHPRLRRTWRHTVERIVVWPVIATTVIVAFIGWAQPAMLSGVIR